MIKIFISGLIKNDLNYVNNFKRIENLILSHYNGLNENYPLRIVNPIINILNGNREDYLRESFKMLLDCNVVVFSYNYLQGEGCKEEYNIAKLCGIKIIIEEEIGGYKTLFPASSQLYNFR